MGGDLSCLSNTAVSNVGRKIGGGLQFGPVRCSKKVFDILFTLILSLSPYFHFGTFNYVCLLTLHEYKLYSHTCIYNLKKYKYVNCV